MNYTTIKFETGRTIDVHELLCRAIHERDPDALDVLTSNVMDIQEERPDDRIDKVLKIVDRIGNKDEADMPTDPESASLTVDIITIGAVLRGQWDVEFDGDGEHYTIIDPTHPKQRN